VRSLVTDSDSKAVGSGVTDVSSVELGDMGSAVCDFMPVTVSSNSPNGAASDL
jgi:hypothetical protein